MTRTALLTVLSGIALLALASLAHATPDPEQPPGQLFSVGGHRLHLYCEGVGEPTVLFESGLGGIGLSWMNVLPRVAQTARACYYDRAGYGWSEPGPLPRTAAVEADELARLLDAAGLTRPVVLVAHSFGGYVAQRFTRRFPARVAGLVLVDASHPGQLAAFPIPSGSYCEAVARGYPLRARVDPNLPASFPAPWRARALRLMLTESAVRTQLSELCNFAQSASEAAGETPFPAVPLTVLSRGRAEFRDSPSGRARELAWATLQAGLAKLTAGARHIVVQGAGHAIHLDGGPRVAAAAAQSVLMARAGGAFEDARLRVARQP